jgi:hypothetical protein
VTKTTLSDNNHLGKIFSKIIDNLNLDEGFKKVGRPYIYSTKSIIKGFLIMVAYRLTSVRSLARFLSEHPEIVKTCQFKDNKVPCYRTFCRRFGCLDNWILQWSRIIITFLIDAKILKLKILIIDGTPCKSKCRKPRKKGAKTTKSDPEARFGYQKWGKECFFGYKSIILASSEPLIVPLAWQVIPANQQEVNYLIPVVSKATWLLEENKKYELISDSGFDAGYNYNWSKELNIRFTCPLNRATKFIGQRLKRQKFYKSKQGQKLYQRRTDIERLNGHLKDLFLIDPFPVKRLKNVNTYLNLVMLLYLAGIYHNYTNGRKLREIKSLIA